MPADRRAILRQAFAEPLKDKSFLGEAEKIKIDIEPISWEETKKIVRDVVDARAEVAAKARGLMGQEK